MLSLRHIEPGHTVLHSEDSADALAVCVRLESVRTVKTRADSWPLSKGVIMARAATSAPSVTRREQLTHDLFKKLASVTDPPGRDDIVDCIVEINLPLSDALANRYRGRGCDVDDLQQVARLGLLIAIDRFDPDRGHSFVQFAVPTITGELKRHFRDSCWQVRPPRTIQELRPQVEQLRTELAQELRRAPRDEELAEHLGTEAEMIRSCDATVTCFRPVSLDVPVGDGLAPTIGACLTSSEQVEGIAERLDLRRAVAQLGERERQVIGWTFLNELSQSQIAQRLGVSQMQVSRILRRTLQELRGALDPLPEAA